MRKLLILLALVSSPALADKTADIYQRCEVIANIHYQISKSRDSGTSARENYAVVKEMKLAPEYEFMRALYKTAVKNVYSNRRIYLVGDPAVVYDVINGECLHQHLK